MTHVVTVFLRGGADVLLVRRSDAVGTYAGLWGGVSGYVEGSPEDAPADARREVREETGIDGATLVRAGDPLDVTDEANDREWTVHPFLFDSDSREVSPNEELADWEWLPPQSMLDRPTVPKLWETYRRVAPTVDSVRGDDTHGAAYVSVRALEALRDEAADVARGLERGSGGGGREHGDDGEDGWARVAAVARELRDARPGMAVVANRINRTMSEAAESGQTPAGVRDAAEAVIRAALDADEGAAARATELLSTLDEGAIATLSRSGTATAALSATERPVLVAESRPGGEGVDAAESFAEAGLDVTLTTDAALAHVAAESDVSAALVGADTVFPDGSVANKAGTRMLALVAEREGVPLYVVAAADKVSADDEFSPESRPESELYDGAAPLSVENPLFDRTPAAFVSGVVTESGVLDAEEVARLAEDRREWREWSE
ncbi:NUDIX domain-containing protein [Haloprofundus sp. MHR1]|uniref:NUDIX domain-containing protein n=1 Tax=Haloprofundus sp. MHR1 TaxID=2572921 RepID=UPI0010BE4199|nr:NUDIX domain-containing protein [Haloprofundus sp. MHR1]QCJ45732.1 NUDIX domain-containing protein [Haloprofundus sp. MHR1]